MQGTHNLTRTVKPIVKKSSNQCTNDSKAYPQVPHARGYNALKFQDFLLLGSVTWWKKKESVKTQILILEKHSDYSNATASYISCRSWISNSRFWLLVCRAFNWKQTSYHHDFWHPWKINGKCCWLICILRVDRANSIFFIIIEWIRANNYTLFCTLDTAETLKTNFFPRGTLPRIRPHNL